MIVKIEPPPPRALPRERETGDFETDGPTRMLATMRNGSDSPRRTPWPDSDWAALMACAQDGDAVAYRRLLHAILPYLRALTGRHFRDRRDAEDVVQDILMSVHAVRHTFDPRRPFAPWLAGVARHRIVDRIRRQVRTRTREVGLPADHETSALFATNMKERDVWSIRALREAVARLPPGQRQAVTLLKLEELTLAEAAAASGRSATALKVACHRAIGTLRIMLGSGIAKT